MNTGQESHVMNDRHRQQEKHVPRMSIHAWARRDRAACDDVDANVLVVQQRIAGAQQEHRGEQVPLELEPGVGGVRMNA